MKTFWFSVVCLVLAATGCRRTASTSSADNGTEASAASKEIVLYDPSTMETGPGVKLLAGPDKLTVAEHERILDAVFGAGRYLKDAQRCKGSSADLDAARRAGDFVPDVTDVATGAFTAPNRKQSLYMIANHECNATNADHWGSATVAIFENDALVARDTLLTDGRLHGVFDIDADGKDEVVVLGMSLNQGFSTESAALYRFENGAFAVLKDFDHVYSGGCQGASDAPTEEFTVIRAVIRPGSTPEFKTESRERPCP
jgi:hypothetical protein